MATVHFSSGMARFTGGVASVTVDASRVRELLVEVTARFPELADPLETMAIAVDGAVYPEPDYVEIDAGSEIHFVPQVAGG